MSPDSPTPVLPVAARYCPYSHLGDQPNIIVDGKEQHATVLTLSHWPWNSTPAELLRDTSTDIAFAYLDSPAHHVAIELVSNSHYDEDGLLSMYTLVDPENALAHRGLMIATSRAGDFAICTDEQAAKLSFILAAYADPELSPLPADVFSGTDAQQIHRLYSVMLKELPELMDHIDEYPQYWEAELAHWRQSETAISEGRVVIDELPHLDLAVVQVPENMPARTVRRYLSRWTRSVHPFAVHNVTHCSRLIWIKGQSLEFQYRYESWVALASRRPQQRVDLAELARELSDLETAAGEWLFEGVNEVAPRLRVAGSCRSSIAPGEFVRRVTEALDKGEPAWDPYNRPD